jgi:hypothetical protein
MEKRIRVRRMVGLLAGLAFVLAVALGWKWWDSPDRRAKAAARSFFEACGKKDWDAMGRLWPIPVDERIKNILGGLHLVSLGEPYRSKDYAGWYIPYEIKLTMMRTLSVRNDNPAKRCILFLDPEHTPDAKAVAEVERLPDNEKYEKMTPEEAVQAFFDACRKNNLDEVRNLLHPSISATDIEKIVKEFGVIQEVHVGECTAGEDVGCWTVPFGFCCAHKFNLAVRNDNPAKRYVVDGGI